MTPTDEQWFALKCLECQGRRVAYMATGPRVLVWINDHMHELKEDGSLGPEID